MKWLKRISVGLLVVAVVLLAIGCLLPSRQRVEHSITITGQPVEVFSRVATLRRWPDWTAWTTNRFPDLTMRFDGPESGAGATMVAAGKSSGDGTVKIMAADPANGIAYLLDFNHGAQLFNGSIRYTNTPQGLVVAWALEADLGANPLKRWGGLALDILMGGDMKQGLANLKRDVEAGR